VVDEGPLAVDLDHRQPLPVARLEIGIAGDVDLAVANALAVEDSTRAVAEVAAARREENDVALYG
jgi:hypothetical protein